MLEPLDMLAQDPYNMFELPILASNVAEVALVSAAGVGVLK
jgi:hypothetical protein